MRNQAIFNYYTMKHLSIFLALICLGSISCSTEVEQEMPLDNYNIIWTTPSENATGSMPVGGGNLQLNAWREKDDLLFYLGSTDSYMDHSTQLGKLGRVRLQIFPNPFSTTFKQELNLQESEIVFTGDEGFQLKVWVDVFHPIVHVEMQSEKPVEVVAHYETWKLEHQFTEDNRILFYHRNASTNAALEKMIEEQRADPFKDKITDPLKNLTSGGVLYAEGLIPFVADSGVYMKTPYHSLVLKSKELLKKLDLRVAIRIEQDETLEQWKEQLYTLTTQTAQTATSDRQQSIAWWKEFWDRSYIHIHPDADPAQMVHADVRKDEKAAAWQVGRNYQLFRYLLGCTHGARHPILFNGGIFNVDNTNGQSPEYRNWQGCEFMAQNQRLVYWPLLKTGDNDLMQPVMNMYRNGIKLQKARAQNYWNIEGAAYPEALNIYGLHAVYADPDMMTDSFGRCANRKREASEYGHSGLIHLEHHYTSMLDFAYMFLEAARFGKEELQRQMPVIENAVKYYDNYYQQCRLALKGERLTANGKLELFPSSALELYCEAKNPTDVVCGLRALVKGVLSFPKEELTEEQYNYFNDVLQRLPQIPTVEKEGRTMLPPAETWKLEGDQPNMEFPQLYALFPFETYSFDDTVGLNIAKNTWLYNSKASAQKNYICWFQGGIFTAHLGLTDEAKSYAINKFLHPLGDRGHKNVPVKRFPVFWDNPGFCQCPDMDHGGAAMIGLQDMLMQTQGQHIYLLPAWPKEWNCNFKLHAPYNTIVQGVIQNGKLQSYKVTPASRKKDVVIMNGF